MDECDLADPEVKDASKGARDTMNAVLKALKQQGVDEKEIKGGPEL